MFSRCEGFGQNIVIRNKHYSHKLVLFLNTFIRKTHAINKKLKNNPLNGLIIINF